MKVIFDSEEQKDQFLEIMASGGCPGSLGLSEDICGYSDHGCEYCWRTCGMEMEFVE